MTTNSFLRNQIEKHGLENSSLIAFKSSEQTISFQQLHLISKNLAELYKSKNLNSQSPVLIYLPQSIEAALIITSLMYSGVPALVIPEGTKGHDVTQMIHDYPFAAVISNTTLSQRVSDLQIDSSIDLELIAGFSNALIFLLDQKNRPQINFNWLLLTSGSTGKAKLVMMSEQNLLDRTLGEIDLFEVKKRHNILNALPYSHDLGLNQLLTALYIGATLEILVKKLPFEFVKRLSEGGFDGLTGMPQLWNNVIHIANKMQIIFSHSGFISVSGGSMPEDKLIELQKVFPNSRIIKTYGQTETFRTLAETRQDSIHHNSCGKVISNVEITLINDQDEPCAPGEAGQLLHQGVGVMTGYWMDEELTEARMKPLSGIKSPLVRTGDYFTLLPDGTYKYEGRKDDMIKHAGRRFFLSEIAVCLRNSNLIKDVFLSQKVNDGALAIGKDQIIAFIIPLQAGTDCSAELKAHCTIYLETFKIPDEFVMCESFPMTANFKIDGKELLKSGKISGNK